MRSEPSHESAWLSLGFGPHLFPENCVGGKEQVLQDAKTIHMSREKKKVLNKKRIRAKPDLGWGVGWEGGLGAPGKGKEMPAGPLRDQV